MWNKLSFVTCSIFPFNSWLWKCQHSDDLFGGNIWDSSSASPFASYVTCQLPCRLFNLRLSFPPSTLILAVVNRIRDTEPVRSTSQQYGVKRKGVLCSWACLNVRKVHTCEFSASWLVVYSFSFCILKNVYLLRFFSCYAANIWSSLPFFKWLYKSSRMLWFIFL